ncbi:MAG: hypothetical protein ACRC7O_03860 [Fimbriiglobus sp.]
MTPFRRLAKNSTVPATAFATALGILLTYPGGISAAYSDICCFDDHAHQLTDEQAAGADLTARTHVIAERINIKEGLVSDLVDGRTTLAAVADRFYELNRDVPACMGAVRSKYPDVPDDERIALNVLDFVRVRELPPDRAGVVFARLAAEYEQMFGHRHRPLN